ALAFEGATQQPSSTSSPQGVLPVSLAHVRAALEQRDSRLALPDRRVDFRVNVRETLPPESVFESLDFKSGPVLPGGLYAFEQRQRFGQAWSQPLILIDMIAVGHTLTTTVARARRARAEHSARDEV